MRTTGGNSEFNIVATPISMQQAGTAIVQDTQSLQTKIKNAWISYGIQTGLVPAMCLRNDFDTFRTQQEPIADKAMENRITIGQTLGKSANLWDFQETVTAKSFTGPDIYLDTPYAATDLPRTNLANQQRPN